jgi:hypothetical protein
MKLSILIILLSLSAQARQYIQCSSSDVYSFDGLVINLNNEQSTLFKTNGVHLPDEDREEYLLDLNFVSKTVDVYTYETEDKVKLEVPTSVIGEYSNSFSVFLSKGSHSKEYYCFSAIYND